MKKLGEELIFISRIKRDGSGINLIPETLIELLQEEKFDLIILSLTKRTFIAANMNLYVVKLKQAMELEIFSDYKKTNRRDKMKTAEEIYYEHFFTGNVYFTKDNVIKAIDEALESGMINKDAMKMSLESYIKMINESVKIIQGMTELLQIEIDKSFEERQRQN